MNDGERKQQESEGLADDEGQELRDGERISESEIGEGDRLDDTPPREGLPGR